MSKLTPEERNKLEQYCGNSFQNVSENNADEVVSILGKLEPEVAIALIGKMPEAIRGLSEINNFYMSLLSKSIESSAAALESCFDTEDKMIFAFSKELEKDIPFEQKQYYVEKMEDAVIRKESKETEHRTTLERFAFWGAVALSFSAGVVGGIFLGGNGFNRPGNIR